MVKNAPVFLTTIGLKVFVEHVIQILPIMVEIVFVIMDFMVMLIDVINVIHLVENAQDLRVTNVFPAQMLVTISKMANVLEIYPVQQVFSWIKIHANHVPLIVKLVNQKISVRTV